MDTCDVETGCGEGERSHVSTAQEVNRPSAGILLPAITSSHPSRRERCWLEWTYPPSRPTVHRGWRMRRCPGVGLLRTGPNRFLEPLGRAYCARGGPNKWPPNTHTRKTARTRRRRRLTARRTRPLWTNVSGSYNFGHTPSGSTGFHPALTTSGAGSGRLFWPSIAYTGPARTN